MSLFFLPVWIALAVGGAYSVNIDAEEFDSNMLCSDNCQFQLSLKTSDPSRYMDPNTTVYVNENMLWGDDEELQLFNFCTFHQYQQHDGR